jgi:tetratricopeptide (TPR) repeat protein
MRVMCHNVDLVSKQNDLALAIHHYDAAIAADPTRAEAFANKGKALADAGRHDEAISALKEAVRLQGGANVIAMLNLGKAYIIHTTTHICSVCWGHQRGDRHLTNRWLISITSVCGL